jgi:hypothetical protein
MTVDDLKQIAKSMDGVSSIETTFTLHYEVLSPRKARWQRGAGPFKTADDAREHLATREGVVSHRVVEQTVIMRIIEEKR